MKRKRKCTLLWEYHETNRPSADTLSTLCKFCAEGSAKTIPGALIPDCGVLCTYIKVVRKVSVGMVKS